MSCKAFDLEDAIKSFAPAVGPQTAIIPMLNGMRHLDILDAKFGRERVLGGLCAIAVTLNDKREVIQLQPQQSLDFGERDGKMSDRVRAIAEVFASGIFGSVASEHIIQDMWEKWVFLASVAGATCLMRGPIGSILAAPGGKDFLLGILDECARSRPPRAIAPRAPFLTRTRGMLTAEGSPITASMFRDIKAGAPVEADHVIGDLIARGELRRCRCRNCAPPTRISRRMRSSGGEARLPSPGGGGVGSHRLRSKMRDGGEVLYPGIRSRREPVTPPRRSVASTLPSREGESVRRIDVTDARDNARALRFPRRSGDRRRRSSRRRRRRFARPICSRAAP